MNSEVKMKPIVLELGRDEVEGVKIQLLSNLPNTQMTLQTMQDVKVEIKTLSVIGKVDERGRPYTMELSAHGQFNKFREFIGLNIGHYRHVDQAIERARVMIRMFSQFSLGAIESILEKNNDRNEFRWFRESVTNDLKVLCQLNRHHDLQFLRLATTLINEGAKTQDWPKDFDKYFSPVHRQLMTDILEHYRGQDARLIDSTSRVYGNNVFELTIRLVLPDTVGTKHTMVAMNYLYSTINPDALEKIHLHMFPRGV